MKVSVIIPTLNEEKNIGRLLDSVNASKYPDKEIVIVDGGSSDSTVEIARSRGARVVKETGNKCPANAKNLGAKAAKGEVLLYLDADTHSISPNFIKDGMKEFSKREVIGVAPNNKRHLGTFWSKALYHSRTLFRWIENLAATGKTSLESNKISYFPNFVRRDVFFKVGGYDIDGLEDQGFYKRYRQFEEKNRKKTVYIGKCELYSQEPGTLGSILRQTKWYGRVFVISNKKNERERYYKLTFFLSIIQGLLVLPLLALIGFYFAYSQLSFILLLLSIPYGVKLLFMFLYALLFKGATYGSKPYVFATIFLDMVSWPWKVAGLLEGFSKKREKDMDFSRGR